MNVVYRLLSVAAAITLAAPPGSLVAVAQTTAPNPPERVGRIAAISGTVSYRLANAQRWDEASINLPLTDGDAVWTEPGSRAELGFGSNRVALGASTEFDLDHLEEHALLATEPQGETYLRLRIVAAGDTYSITTPRGIVAITGVGRYEVIAGDQEHPTTVTVLEGSAQVTGLPAPQQVGVNQTLTITGDGTSVPFQPSLGPAVRDAFLTAMLAEERPPPRQAVAAPPYVAGMTGAEALDEYGEWSASPDYGEVWYPRAETGFVPYRDGHWAYVQPWGWTWVDNAPWGFAPSHYGRWAFIDGRWAWVPGRPPAPQAYPVYAPALVGFLGGAAAGAVTWVPLGPNEPYRPPYQTSDRYLRDLNQFSVANPADIGRAYGRPLVNRDAITSVPAEVMTASRNVAQAPRLAPPPATDHPQIAFQPTVKPSTATVGVTQAVARELDLPQEQAAARPAPGPAPGPAFRAGGVAAGVVAGAAAGAAAGPLLRPATPGQQATPAGLPQLRPQGTRPNAGAPGPVAPAGQTTPAPTQSPAPSPNVTLPGLRNATRPAGQPSAPPTSAQPAPPTPAQPAPSTPVARPGATPALRPGTPQTIAPAATPSPPTPRTTEPTAPQPSRTPAAEPQHPAAAPPRTPEPPHQAVAPQRAPEPAQPEAARRPEPPHPAAAPQRPPEPQRPAAVPQQHQEPARPAAAQPQHEPPHPQAQPQRRPEERQP